MLPLRGGFGQSAIEGEGLLDRFDQERIALLTCQVESSFFVSQRLLEPASLGVALCQEVVQGRRGIDLGLEPDGSGVVLQGLVGTIEIGQSQREPIVGRGVIRSEAQCL